MLTRFLALSLLATAAMQPITIKTTTLFDGHGHVFRNRQITIEDGRITRIAGHVLLTINADFERAAKGCFGVIRGKLERDRELYGYGWIGWGQAFGNNWKTCGGLPGGYGVPTARPSPRFGRRDEDTERDGGILSLPDFATGRRKAASHCAMQAKVASSETAQERSAPRGPGTTQPGRPSHYSAPAPGAREAAYGGSYFRCGAGAICPQSGSRERTKAAAGHATFAHVAPLAPSVTQCATGAHGRAPGPKTRCGDAKRKGRDRSGASDKAAPIVGASMRACWGADEYRGRVEGIAPDLLAQFELLEEVFRGRPGVVVVRGGRGWQNGPAHDGYIPEEV